MALNGVCGKTSSDDTFKYIIGGKESYLLVTNSSPSYSFPTLHDIYIENFTLTRKEFHKLLSGHSLAKGMLNRKASKNNKLPKLMQIKYRRLTFHSTF